ncbi:unnamed protein product [Closterium sp. Naga37s-1]|nr:unnamed protein product [Closterium sp. Naga37s-1]
MQLWTELLRPGSPYSTHDISSDETSTTSSQPGFGIAAASDPYVNGTLNGTLTESSYTVVSDKGSTDMVPLNAAAALAPSDGSADPSQEASPLQQQSQQQQLQQQQQQQEEEEEEEEEVEEEVPSGAPLPPLGARVELSVPRLVLPPVPPRVLPPIPPHLVNCEAMINAVTQYERFARGRHRVEEVPWALIREKKGGGSMDKIRVVRARGISGGFSNHGMEEIPRSQVPQEKGGGSFQEFSQERKRESASHAVPAERKECLWFLYATFVPQSKYGIGAQLTNVAGALALAVASGRVLPLFHRRAHDLMAEQQAQHPATAEPGSNLLAESNLPAESDVHSSLPVVRRQDIPEELLWFPPVPSLWGQPWLRIPAVIEINGHMRQTTKTGNKDRWWRAQAWRFLMRSPSRYLCAALNRARHAAFGPMAARHVAHAEATMLQAEKLGFAASTLPPGTNQLSADYPLLGGSQSSLFQTSHPKSNEGVQSGTSESNDSQGGLLDTISVPWVPRPMVSMHVRMGDKAKEMRVAGFGTYLHLLSRVRQFDPSATTVWLSTEMQPVR